MIDFEINKEETGMPLFDMLEKRYPNFSDRDMLAAFKAGDILLNGKDAFGDDEANEGDVVELFVPSDVMGIDIDPRIVYQDENFVIVDKPSGLLSISDDAEEVTAVTKVEEMMKARGEYSVGALMVPYLMYPLHQYESGLLLMAKHEEGYLFMTDALRQRRLALRYICPVKGKTEERKELMAYLKREKSGKVRILSKFQKDAKPIVTRYETVSNGKTMSLVSARAITNYRQQVRAHFAFAGMPVLGDSVYGDKRFNRRSGADSVCLWLKTLTFEIGLRHEYEYINGLSFESETFSFPRSVYDEGLLD